MSLRPSLASAASAPLGAQPGTPVPDLILQASQTSRPSSSVSSLRSSTLARARQFDGDARGQKRAAEDVLTPGKVSPAGSGEQAQASEVPVRVDGQEALEVFAGLTMTYDQAQALAAERTDMCILCYSFPVWLIWTEEIRLNLKNMTMALGMVDGRSCVSETGTCCSPLVHNCLLVSGLVKRLQFKPLAKSIIGAR